MNILSSTKYKKLNHRANTTVKIRIHVHQSVPTEITFYKVYNGLSTLY